VNVGGDVGIAPVDLARAFLDGGARFLQIRAKRLASGPLLELCDEVVRLGGSYGAAVIVNDRVDLARLSGAAGVHVGQDDLPVAAARALLGPEAIVGFSTHSVEQIDRALDTPISYVAVGPVFGTQTKETGYEAVGLHLVREAVARARGVPVVAIGGITLANARQVIEAGAAGVAVISDLVATGDPAARVHAFVNALEGGSEDPPLRSRS
jgi:thiamine-phosphate pyrophosphorylase